MVDTRDLKSLASSVPVRVRPPAPTKVVNKTLIRKVIVSEPDLAKLTCKATKKSDYGHLKLYDSIEWRPISKHDYLIDLIRDGKKGFDYWIWEKKRFFYTPNKDIDWLWRDNILVGRTKYAKDFHIYGWATLTKEL